MAMLKGLKNFYYALQTKDDTTGVAYDTPYLIPGLNKCGVKRKTNRDIFYADNQAWEKTTSRDITDIELVVADLPIEHKARLLGHSMVGARMVPNVADIAPIVAIGIEVAKSNNKRILCWFYGCQFEDGDDDHESTGSAVKLKAPTIKASSMPHKYNGDIENILDEESVNYTAIQSTTFFNNPISTIDAIIPTATIVPLNSATAVAITTAVNWTFSEAIQFSTVTAANFMLVADVAGTLVAGTLSVNALRTIVTFTPTASLTTAIAYRAIATSGVKDLSGNSLAMMITKFTCA